MTSVDFFEVMGDFEFFEDHGFLQFHTVQYSSNDLDDLDEGLVPILGSPYVAILPPPYCEVARMITCRDCTDCGCDF